MGGSKAPSRDWRSPVGALLLLCLPPLVAACAASSYPGIPLAGAAADPGLQSLAREGSGPIVATRGPDAAAGGAFPVEKFFPDRLMDGLCGHAAGSQAVRDPSGTAGAGEDRNPPDLDCYPVERPQWPAPAGRSAFFYLANLRNFLVENRDHLASYPLSTLLRSSGLLEFERNGFALYSVMALAMAKQEGGCAIYVGRLAYLHGVREAFDDTMWLLNRSPAGIRLSAHCTQPEIARIMARANPALREVPVPDESRAGWFAAGYFPLSVLDGRCLVGPGSTPAVGELADLDRAFPMYDPPDLDCYRTSGFAWPAAAGRGTWFYLGNLLGYLRHVEGRISDRSVEEMLASSRILDGEPNGYVFFVLARILEAKGEIGCALSFAELAYANGVLEANSTPNEILSRNRHPTDDQCRSERLRSVLAGHGAGDGR